MIMEKKYLVLGATGGIGYAYTNELLRNGIKASILVRDRVKAEQMFNKNPLLNILEGDVNDIGRLRSSMQDADVIFFGINYPYHLWDRYMKSITSNVINTATYNGATILFPGNIYSFGNMKDPIKESTIPAPTSKKGKLRNEMEIMLQEAASKGKCRVINLRLPDFWGPNVNNGLIKPLLGNAARGKTMHWMVKADVPHQFVYTSDAAQLFHKVSLEPGLPPYYVLNYGGQVLPSVAMFAERISSIASSPNRLKIYSKRTLKILGLFLPLVKELIENLYQFENCVVLDDSKLRSIYADWQDTPLEAAIHDTIEWFRLN
jgi:nucleoside-diphosphate-sugar epimerase